MDDIENKYDAQFKVVFDAIRQLMMPPQRQIRKIGFSDLIRKNRRKLELSKGSGVKPSTVIGDRYL